MKKFLQDIERVLHDLAPEHSYVDGRIEPRLKSLETHERLRCYAMGQVHAMMGVHDVKGVFEEDDSE